MGYSFRDRIAHTTAFVTPVVEHWLGREIANRKLVQSKAVLKLMVENSQIAREETCCCHYMGYHFQLAAMVLLYTPSHRQDSRYHGFCYTSCGALAGMKNKLNGTIMRDRSDNSSPHLWTLTQFFLGFFLKRLNNFSINAPFSMQSDIFM